MKLCDAHCHLQDERLVPVLSDVLARAEEAGVWRMVCCGAEETDWARVAELSEQETRIFPSFGLHPWYVGRRSPDWFDILQDYISRYPAGVGEIGLDHALKDREDALQEDVFVQQLKLAQDWGRPVSIHCRRAWGRMLDVLKKYGPFPAGFVIHSYSGSPDLIPAFVSLGGYISFSCSITSSHNKKGHRSLCAVPRDRLLFETDAPDIPPIIDGLLSDQPNEPANLWFVIKKAAELLELPVERVASLSWENAATLFVKDFKTV